MNKNEGALFSMTKQHWNEKKSLSLYQNFKLIFINFLQWFVDFLFSLLFIYGKFHISNYLVRKGLQKYVWNKKVLAVFMIWFTEDSTGNLMWEQCSHMRFPTNFIDQHNLNSLNLFPNSECLRYVSFHKCLIRE